MKRLNSYLLTNYPLLWNLRLHFVWPAIIVLHMLFFLWGFSNAGLQNSWRYRRFEPDGEVVTIAVLLGLLTGILWLALYFRSNAFKSFYPLKRGRLALETILVFVTGFGIFSFAETYRTGGAMRIRQQGMGVNVEAEQETIALAKHFLPFYLSGFSRFEECNAQPAASVATDSGGVAVDTFSYLNYCYGAMRTYENDTVIYSLSEPTKRARRWLEAGNRDSVEWVLREYLKIVASHGGTYLLDPRKHVASMFSKPGLPLQYTIRSVPEYGNSNAVTVEGAIDATMVTETVSDGDRQAPELRYGDKYAFVESAKTDEWLRQLEYARRGSYRLETMLFLLYGALTLTILVMGFRLTELRAWVVAVIGGVLWAIIIGLGLAVMHGESGVVGLILLLEAIFTGVAVFLIQGGGGRRVAGVVYLWSLAGMPFVLPMIWLWLRQIGEAKYYGNEQYAKPSAYYEFLREYQDWCITANVGVSLLLILLIYIPLARKWQAMPAE